jgi:glycosyltransferase involved in cell wall biosynthesis
MPAVLQVTTVALTLRAFLRPLAEHFRRQGWRVDGFANGAESCAECRASFDRTWDASWTRSAASLSGMVRAARALRRLVAQQRYDLVHVHTPIAGFVTRLALRGVHRGRRPAVIYTAHGFHFHPRGSALGNALYAAAERLAGRWTDYLVVINHDDEAAALRHALVPAHRLRYMPGIGIATQAYAPGAVSAERVGAVRDALGMRAAERLLLVVAEFNPGKRNRDVIDAFARLGRDDVHLAFAGDGPLLAACKALASKLGVASRTHFLGFRGDVPVLLAAADAVLLLSEREGLPRSVMEALCCGKAVIGTDVRGVRDLLGDDCGILVPVGDVDAVVGALERVLDDAAGAAAMGQRARRKMIGYDEQTVLSLHEQLYAEALTASHASRD